MLQTSEYPAEIGDLSQLDKQNFFGCEDGAARYKSALFYRLVPQEIALVCRKQ